MKTTKEIQKAKDIYTKAYALGSVSAGYRLSYLLEDLKKTKESQENIQKDKKNGERKSKEAKKILKIWLKTEMTTQW